MQRSALDAVEMGRGDRRTKRGKRKLKSFGVSRPRNGELRKREKGPSPPPLAVADAPVE